ncbi:MAG: aminopeptidase P family N-terminal domain-containing protein, partial [Rhizobiales bacterium]|nr:aminopeptidase P family N-terminal domain-containing protein [Hyphomicrobiales bacterium]
MTLPFSKSEFKTRTAKVRQRMGEQGVDLLLVSDPANIYW